MHLEVLSKCILRAVDKIQSILCALFSYVCVWVGVVKERSLGINCKACCFVYVYGVGGVMHFLI